MKKQSAQLLILVTILILCVGGYFAVRSLPEETEVTSESYTVSQIDKETVVEISYLNEGEIIELKKEDDTWSLVSDPSIALEQSKIDTMLGYVCSISTDTVIEGVDSLEEYGLTNPSNTICLTLEDGSAVQFLIGDYMDMTGDYYLLLAGDVNVYTVSSYIPSAFEKSVEDLTATEEESTT